jgi:hypothetical protein
VARSIRVLYQGVQGRSGGAAAGGRDGGGAVTLPSEPHLERGLTIASAASNSHWLVVGLLWLSSGMTVVVSHMLFVYALFRGRSPRAVRSPRASSTPL